MSPFWAGVLVGGPIWLCGVVVLGYVLCGTWRKP